MSDRTHFVYVAEDHAGRVLYVGCTGNLTRRARDHRARSVWFPHAARFRLTGPLTRGAAYDLEADRIATLHPIFNVTRTDRGQSVARAAAEARAFRDQQLAHYRDHGTWPAEDLLDAMHDRAEAYAEQIYGPAENSRTRLARYLAGAA